MHSNMLDYPALIEDAMRSNTLAGTFKKFGNFFGKLPPAWHFAGTFFWIRNLKLFGSDLWDRVPRQWWGPESWPGIVCPDDEGALHALNWKAGNALPVTKQEYWNESQNAAWQQWQIKNGKLRVPALRTLEVLNTIRATGDKRILVTRRPPGDRGL